MVKMKVHIRHVMLWEFKNNETAIEITKRISSIHVKDVINNGKASNCFSKFRSGDTSLKDEPRPGCSLDLDRDALRELVEYNPRKSTRELALDLNTSQSTICGHLKKMRKVSKKIFK